MEINFLDRKWDQNELYRNRTLCVRYRTDKSIICLINYWKPKESRLAHCCVILLYDFSNVMFCHPVFLHVLVI